MSGVPSKSAQLVQWCQKSPSRLDAGLTCHILLARHKTHVSWWRQFPQFTCPSRHSPSLLKLEGLHNGDDHRYEKAGAEQRPSSV